MPGAPRRRGGRGGPAARRPLAVCMSCSCVGPRGRKVPFSLFFYRFCVSPPPPVNVFQLLMPSAPCPNTPNMQYPLGCGSGGGPAAGGGPGAARPFASPLFPSFCCFVVCFWFLVFFLIILF